MDAVISPQRVAEQAFQQESGEEDSKERKENAAQQEAVRVPDAGQSANEETCSTLTKTTGPESSASGAGTKSKSEYSLNCVSNSWMMPRIS